MRWLSVLLWLAACGEKAAPPAPTPTPTPTGACVGAWSFTAKRGECGDEAKPIKRTYFVTLEAGRYVARFGSVELTVRGWKDAGGTCELALEESAALVTTLRDDGTTRSGRGVAAQCSFDAVEVRRLPIDPARVAALSGTTTSVPRGSKCGGRWSFSFVRSARGDCGESLGPSARSYRVSVAGDALVAHADDRPVGVVAFEETTAGCDLVLEDRGVVGVVYTFALRHEGRRHVGSGTEVGDQMCRHELGVVGLKHELIP